MTRAQKKCLVVSFGLHGLLLVIVVICAAFRTRTDKAELQIINFIPARILDKAGVGGGAPQPAVTRAQPTPPAPAPAPAPAPTVAVAQPRTVEPVREEKPRETEPEPQRSDLPSPKSSKKHHEIKPDYTPVDHKSSSKKKDSAATAQADADRRLKQIERSLGGLASTVQKSAATSTVVDMPGQADGGESFADYRTVVFNAYFDAWGAPDDVADKLAHAVARVDVARDGSIISAEIVDRSGHSSIDNSVDRALRKVTQLPPFPSSTSDSHRVFLIKFNLEAKQSAG